MLSSHNINDSDAYKRPSFSFVNKLRRLLWQISWKITCSWTPNNAHRWRVIILKMFGAKIGESNFIYPNCKIWAPWLLETEDVVTIGPCVEIYNPGGVYIGHHAILSQDSYLCGATHDFDSQDFTYIKKKIEIAPYVWICAKAVVLPGVVCSEGSVLGACALASKSLDPWIVYAGNPAKAIRKRNRFLDVQNNKA